MAKTLEDFFDKVEENGQLPTLPTVITLVLELIRSPKTSASDIGKVISDDPALSLKILKIVNSAFYGFPKKIGSITQAVVILGFNTIKSAILGVSVINAFENTKLTNANFTHHDFWTHAIGVAATARAITKRLGHDFMEEAFIAGILHDVGKLIVDQFSHEQFQEIFEKIKNDRKTYLAAEKEVIGLGHPEIAAYLIKKWNFPEMLINGVLYHHDPQLADKQHEKICAIIHLADIISKSLYLGSSGDIRIPKLNPRSWDLLDIELSSLEEIMELALLEFRNSHVFLTLADSESSLKFL